VDRHPKHPVDLFLLLVDADRVLLALRAGTGYADGWWNAPSGKLEVGETALAGIRREAAEEIGLRFGADEPRLAATVHHRNRDEQGRIGLVFTADFDAARHGEPVNREPHKCGEIRWFPLDELPEATDRYTAACITAWRTGTSLQLSGWQ
jgi:ADP-ribose pyrophosphatase YjhB (NUDIX family)